MTHTTHDGKALTLLVVEDDDAIGLEPPQSLADQIDGGAPYRPPHRRRARLHQPLLRRG